MFAVYFLKLFFTLVCFIGAAMTKNKCTEALRCFYNGPPFYHFLYRPISFSPNTDIVTKFVLYTQSNRQEGEEIEATGESIRSSSFNSEMPVKVLIHGYRTELEVDHMLFQIKDAYLNVGDFNIIIVNWTEHNGFPYSRAFSNARVVGAQLAYLLKMITEFTGARPRYIHIIGHSMGAHIAGWTGERIPNIGRITGLDPAGPYFRNADDVVRLDPTDALFVDVIHTDAGGFLFNGFGIGDPLGHVDFYPNGGSRQPGCTVSSLRDTGEAPSDGTPFFPANVCDHSRAIDYFAESIRNPSCRFMAAMCDSYEDFEAGRCLSGENVTRCEMGFRARRPRGAPVNSKFYTRTNATAPFCIRRAAYRRKD